MLKFIWGRGQGPTAERGKLQKELFNFSKNVTYGFPSKPGDALLIFCNLKLKRLFCFLAYDSVSAILEFRGVSNDKLLVAHYSSIGVSVTKLKADMCGELAIQWQFAKWGWIVHFQLDAK